MKEERTKTLTLLSHEQLSEKDLPEREQLGFSLINGEDEGSVKEDTL